MATRRRTLAILALCGFAYSLLPVTIASLVPVVQREYGASAVLAAWLLTGYQVAAATAAPVLGRLGDVFGRVRVLTLVLTLFAAGTLACATTHSLAVLIGGRIVQGVGESVFPLVFGIIRAEFPADEVAPAIGLTSATIGVGAISGLLLGTVILDDLDYHWLFWIALVPVVAAALATRFGIPEVPHRVRSAPLFARRGVRVPGVRAAHAIAFLCGFGMFAQLIVLPQVIQAPAGGGFGLGLSAGASAFFLLPSAFGMIVGSPLAGRLSGRFGPRMPLAAGIACAVAGWAELLALHGATWQVALCNLLIGTGLGLSFAGMATVLVDIVPADRIGEVTGVNAIMRNIGGAVSAQAVAAFLTVGYVAAIASAGLTLVVALVACLGLPRRLPRSQTRDFAGGLG